MPSQEGDVLPTRFGNAIKAFEVYPRDIYGADGVVIWLRLASVMPKAFSDQIQDIRSQIDFLINCCLFSAIVGLLGFVRTIYSGNWHDMDLQTVAGIHAFISSTEKHWLIWTAGGAVGTYFFYRWAVTIVPAWGSLVMSAFDCYLPALAGQLGFELPITEAKRRNFWTTLSQQLIYRREPDGKMPFRIEKWKQVQSTTVGKGVEGGTESQPGKAQESGDDFGGCRSGITTSVSLSGALAVSASILGPLGVNSVIENSDPIFRKGSEAEIQTETLPAEGCWLSATNRGREAHWRRHSHIRPRGSLRGGTGAREVVPTVRAPAARWRGAPRAQTGLGGRAPVGFLWPRASLGVPGPPLALPGLQLHHTSAATLDLRHRMACLDGRFREIGEILASARTCGLRKGKI